MSLNRSVTEVIAAMLHAIDTLNWTGVRTAFADKVTVDYTSLTGGEKETIAADTLIDRWRQLFPGYDATQHLAGPVLVVADDGHTRSCVTAVRAYHHVADAETWLVAGYCHIDLVPAPGNWLITSLTLDTLYQDGDRTLASRAEERVATGSGGRTAVAR